MFTYACAQTQSHSYMYVCACDSHNLGYCMLFFCETMKIFYQDKILTSKLHSQGGKDGVGLRELDGCAGDSMKSKLWLWLYCIMT